MSGRPRTEKNTTAMDGGWRVKENDREDQKNRESVECGRQRFVKTGKEQSKREKVKNKKE